MEDDVDGFPDSYYVKSSARVFDTINNEKDGVLLLSKFVELIETLREGFLTEDLIGNM